ncbi:tetratricopeptide repeat-containing sensor histidine kinase [Sediminibacterium soli]|uniref:tetratricopeptide repeat-containing sensor histidine kinase n=1 Tax=Sediminibacterium soli TaxID=2698829 RepID=UPI00137B23B2|nr:tetratricopeptide repeat-containing sensor histidine kinase [Sediminibacterium soli]NCI45534.1 sensor histidine kinase [Sediminibacterium soli]
MTRPNRLYPAFLLIFHTVLAFSPLMAADKPASADTRTVDSLNELAFKQKRFDVPRALSNLSMAQNIAGSVNYLKGLGISYMYEAGIFYQNGYDKKALSTYYKSLQLFQNLADTFHIAFVSQQIAGSLQANKRYAEAMRLYQEALAVFTKMNKREDIVNAKNSMGLLNLALNKLPEAEKYFTEALAMARAIGYAYGEKKALHNRGVLEKQRGNLADAENYFRMALQCDEKAHDLYGAALNQLELSHLFSKQLSHDSAIGMAMEAYRNAYRISAYNLLKDAATQLIQTYRALGIAAKTAQWQDSLLNIFRIQIENERMYALNFIDVIKSQDLQKVNAEKEANTARRVQQEQLLVITVGTFILIIVAVLAVLALVNYQRQRFFGKELKQKNEIIEKNSASLDQLNKEISHQNALLEEDNKTKNKLLSIISHDLRTPLVNTKGILNLVNQGMVPKDEAERLLQQLETQYIGTTSLLDNLLFWIKGQMNGQQNEKVKLNLFLLIKTLEDEQRLPLEKKEIVLRNEVDRDISIVAEKELIRICCRNLISNAIKFTNPGGFIEIRSRIEGKNLCIVIADSGIGMTREAIEKVNAKVYYNTKGTSFEKGSGFGLMLCRDLIAKQGGELLVKSEPGKGSEFTIVLPHNG